MKQRHMSNLSKLCSLFCLRTNKINIKINVTCEETCSSTLQRFLIIRALKRFFLLIETWVSCTFTKCFHCFPHALLEKLFYSISEKLQDIFKRRRSFQFCWDGKLYNVDVKWTMAERNTCSRNTFWLCKVFEVAKSFRLYENTSHEQVLQWNKSMR